MKIKWLVWSESRVYPTSEAATRQVARLVADHPSFRFKVGSTRVIASTGKTILWFVVKAAKKEALDG